LFPLSILQLWGLPIDFRFVVRIFIIGGGKVIWKNLSNGLEKLNTWQTRFIFRRQGFKPTLKKLFDFWKKTENRLDILKKLKALPPAWTENILIVDDEEWNLNSVRPGPGVKMCSGS